MKATFVAGVAGVLVGAGLVTLTSRPVVATRAAEHEPQPAAPSQLAIGVPPGWDTRYLARLSAVEDKVAALQTPGERPEAREPNARHEELAQQYQKGLALLEESLRQHADEAFDTPWAPAQAESMRGQLAAIAPREHAFEVEAVDCRSKTCVADLLYPTPDDALEGRGAVQDAFVTGCSGMVSVLEPPAGPGPYRTKLLYTCR
jgi:hypothetical protein